MIPISPEVNYIELYFTLKCNLSCHYCINEHSTVKRHREELPVDRLIKAIERLDFSKHILTIGGGEPTVRKDFYDFVNNLPSRVSIDLLSNLQFDVEEFVNRVDRSRFSTGKTGAYKSIRISYHPSTMNPHALIEKAKYLQDNGFSIGIFGINHPGNTEANIEMSEIAREKQIYFFIKDFLGEFYGTKFGFYKYPDSVGQETLKSCKCRTHEMLIDPAGNVFKCHRDLYINEFLVGNITDESFVPEFTFRECSKYGDCNPCDVKVKTNRFLQMGKCAVDIEF
jgi:radical SAM protein with 4Fe4S-binding SPASM domain